MRNFVNAILTFIGSWSLTDEEFSALSSDDPAYTVETYTTIKEVLEEREGVSTYVARLNAYFTARGIDVGDETVTASSKIYIGDAL